MNGCRRRSDGANSLPPGTGPRSSELVREGVTLRLALAAVLAAAEEARTISALLGEMLRHIERWRAPARGGKR